MAQKTSTWAAFGESFHPRTLCIPHQMFSPPIKQTEETPNPGRRDMAKIKQFTCDIRQQKGSRRPFDPRWSREWQDGTGREKRTMSVLGRDFMDLFGARGSTSAAFYLLAGAIKRN